jgi:hypothetical protein
VHHIVKWGPVDGCRIDVRLTDQGYVMPDLPSFNLITNDLGDSVTVMDDQVSVRNGHFDKIIDMSEDPNIYPFLAQKYTISAWFNPGNDMDCPVNVQDRIGWLGEGLDPHSQYYDTSGVVPGLENHPVKGLILLKKTFTLTRADLVTTSGKSVFN